MVTPHQIGYANHSAAADTSMTVDVYGSTGTTLFVDELYLLPQPIDAGGWLGIVNRIPPMHLRLIWILQFAEVQHCSGAGRRFRHAATQIETILDPRIVRRLARQPINYCMDSQDGKGRGDYNDDRPVPMPQSLHHAPYIDKR
jgi:hypothetical protein